MRVFRGMAVSHGYADGKALVRGPSFGKTRVAPRRRIDLEEVEFERARLRDAIAMAVEELGQLQEDVESMLGQIAADILGAHIMLLSDRTFEAAIMGRVENELVNAEHALVIATGRLSEALSRSRSDYLKRRARDVSDISRRVMRHMGHPEDERLTRLEPGTVVIAEDLLPSDAIDLARAPEVAAATERGDETGYLAILARDLGIPSVCCVRGILNSVIDGDRVLVDAEHGEIIVNPTVERAEQFAAAKRSFKSALRV